MIDYMNQLEERVTHLAGLYASLREKNDELSRENAEMKGRIDEMERENSMLRETQGKVRERVEALIKRMEELEG